MPDSPAATEPVPMAASMTPRERRREAMVAEIIDAAWDLCREDGLASLSLRELAKRVGMRAPSLYSYFDSKDAIYDAMFRQGQEQLAAHMAPVVEARPVTRRLLKEGIWLWFGFCTSDPVRYQLMYQRTIPGFQPSEASYSLAVEQLESVEAMMAGLGITDPGALDVWTALITGLTSQQISNDPGGDRWARVLDESLDMFLDRHGVLLDQGE